MSAKLVLNYVLSIDVCLVFAALIAVLRSGAHRKMLAFPLLLGVAAIHMSMDVAVMYHRKQFGVSPALACNILRFGGWAASLAEVVLLVLTVYAIFRSLMEPLQGLHRMGTLVFRWVGAVALCLACMVMFGPHSAGVSELATLCGRFQEGAAILTLCLLLAVSFATRPLGLSVRSRLFGMLLGLGVVSTASLITSTWFAEAEAQSPYAAAYLIGAFAFLVASATWTVYFAVPEPARRMITLPTTSPFFFWNRIAEALGDAPGEVAIAGFSPEMFAPAELLAFSSRPAAPVIEMPQVARR